MNIIYNIIHWYHMWSMSYIKTRPLHVQVSGLPVECMLYVFGRVQPSFLQKVYNITPPSQFILLWPVQELYCTTYNIVSQ